MCGLYDITPAKAGLASNQIIRFAKDYAGETSQIYDGVDVTVNARPTGRLFLQAGVSTGRTVTKNCAVVDNPQTLRFCEVTAAVPGELPRLGRLHVPVAVAGERRVPEPSARSGHQRHDDAGSPAIAVANYPVTNATPGLTLGRPIATPGGVDQRALD